MKGIEPSYTAWEAVILPLNYIRLLLESQNNIFSPKMQSLKHFITIFLAIF